MHVSTDTAFLLAAILGLSGAALAVASRYLPRPRRTTPPEPTGGPVPTGFRWCPIEQRVRAAVLHADGSATCADPDCGAHIPATEADRA